MTWLVERWKRLLASSILLATLMGNQGFRSLVRNWMELRNLRRQIAQLEGERISQQQRLRALQSGDVALERLVRRELDYVKKGEIEYRFASPKAAN